MLKRLFFILLLSLGTLFGGEVFWNDSYKEALQEAKESHKALLVFMSQEGCHACEFMEDKVLFTKEVENYIDAHFAAVHLDIHDNDAPKKLQIGMTPTFYFLDENENSLHEMVVGGLNKKSFLQVLQEAIAKK